MLGYLGPGSAPPGSSPGAIALGFTGATDALLPSKLDGAPAIADDPHLVLGAVEIARGLVGGRTRQRVGLDCWTATRPAGLSREERQILRPGHHQPEDRDHSGEGRKAECEPQPEQPVVRWRQRRA